MNHVLPSGPQAHPFLQLLQWIGRPVGIMEDCARRYGDLFTLRLGPIGPVVFCSHPQMLQEIFTLEAHSFYAGAGNQLLRPLLGDTSLILLDGDRHQRQRQLLVPPFHGERTRTYSNLIVEITQQVSAGWQLGQPFTVRSALQNISLQVILQAVFGITDPQRYHTLSQLLPTLIDRVSSPLSSSILFLPSLQQDWGAWSPWGQFIRQRSQLNQLLYQEIAERRADLDPERSDILTLMLMARDEEGQPMTDVELRDELVTLLMAGHETTASAMTWALYWLARSPAIATRLLAELESCDDLNDAKTLSRLPYLSAVCSETLRIYPVAPIAFPRILLEPRTLMGQTFERGTYLAPCIYLTHHRSDLYPNPDVFDPDRFLSRTYSPYEFVGFGGGNRRCLGMSLALFEMKRVLATLLTQFRFELLDTRPVRPVRRGVTLAPPAQFALRPVALR
ncbi:MAG: cytochrome P450 [Thermosynechococcaceae cyanobacterium MS004]|nr:cytochrome P450 [Thermosynechococcaceae cyanobacterium MS004]